MSEYIFEEIYKKIIAKLEQDLPGSLAYHNAHHTKYVVEMAEKLAVYENITGRDLQLVKLAALYHDTGFLLHREEHESLGCQIASRDLEGTLTTAELGKVCGMIAATKIPQRPKNKMEKIVADADLFYLGTSNYKKYSQKLYLELKHFDPSINEEKWLKIQIDFLSSHSYHTDYARENLQPIKQKVLNSLLVDR
ncbi:HD domain-containing protein [Gillisia limnaea]|uniref:Metal-dependent phosphohydrolase HD sub domain-containing protein n=1 Tax=Gillisia limnaea (strain DSM 15749 / LMG 21470 / R-8282) TaxID=865937 RepID=H2BW48_GILLR|nr:HD domain-containing protein [Gillisia limnaea]EHQ02965.1 metal-dependent phosphohydrolase HD sub domain-containing protein [Gillisia limnaea DSM 15749]